MEITFSMPFEQYQELIAKYPGLKEDLELICIDDEDTRLDEIIARLEEIKNTNSDNHQALENMIYSIHNEVQEIYYKMT